MKMSATHRSTGFYIKIKKNMVDEETLFFGFKNGQHSALTPREFSSFASWLQSVGGQIHAEVRKRTLKERA